MKKPLCLFACLATLASATAQSPQPSATPRPATPAPAGEDYRERLQQVIQRSSAPAPESVLTKFSLDFPGGTPKQLVAAIEKAAGKPLNAIIPSEHGDTKLPPLKMSNVNVSQLFQALLMASRSAQAIRSNPGSSSYQISNTAYGFRTEGATSDDSIWYFYVEKPTLPPAEVDTPRKVCRYFSLAPYLEDGQTVEDITTAIQTGWKMLGDKETPAISFHKETKLLIAVGEPEKLETIDAVLKALKMPITTWSIDPATGLPVPPRSRSVDATSGLPTPITPRIPQRELKRTPTGATVPPSDSPAPTKP